MLEKRNLSLVTPEEIYSVLHSLVPQDKDTIIQKCKNTPYFEEHNCLKNTYEEMTDHECVKFLMNNIKHCLDRRGTGGFRVSEKEVEFYSFEKPNTNVTQYVFRIGDKKFINHGILYYDD